MNTDEKNRDGNIDLSQVYCVILKCKGYAFFHYNNHTCFPVFSSDGQILFGLLFLIHLVFV